MSSMVLTQLLNPDAGVDRRAPGTAVDSGGQGRAEEGPSRYDDIVRQQEKRLEQRRSEDRATRQRRQDQARDSERQQEKAELARSRENGPGDDNAGAATERRAEHTDGNRQPAKNRESGAGGKDDRTGETAATTDTTATERRGKPQPEAEEVVIAELAEALTSGDQAGMTGVVVQTPAANGTDPIRGVADQARSAARVMASLTGAGQKPGSPPVTGELFAAMLEAGQESRGKGSDLLAGLQNGSLQGLQESTGKLTDSLTAQVTSRLSAPELTQTLNQPAGLRGQEAQALMRNYSTSVDVPVGADEWGEKVMGKLAWLTASQMSVAEIHVTPPELGPIDVRVQVQNDQATVTVHATTPAVREQLELHGHRLRDMLNGQGLNLEGFDVSDSAGREAADQHGEGDDPEGRAGGSAMAGDAAETGAEPLNSGELDLSWNGEVDLYA